MINKDAYESRTIGWLTTDNDEIALRQKRGAEEAMNIAASAVRDGFHGDYEVTSKVSGQRYGVEIRSLDKLENSCTCTDFRHNGLGTCKHIEATLRHLKRRQRAFKSACSSGSPMVEIFVKHAEDTPFVCVKWPQRKLFSRLKHELAIFFDEHGKLKEKSLRAVPALQCIAERFEKDVRISAEVISLGVRLRREHDRQVARHSFLEDVQNGKRTMNILNSRLYPYQQDGMLHLAFGERVLLADEMGLGKTIQAIAACELLRRIRGVQRVLIVTPASLKLEWEEQIKRFTGQSLNVVYGLRGDRLKQYRSDAFFNICNYEQVRVDVHEINTILAPDIVVLDEAQRIKNWTSKTARQIKRLTAPYAFVLTGTPLENRIEEVYSIVEFLDPGIFGPLFRFNREFYKLNEHGRPIEVYNLGELHRRISPIMLRRRKAEVEEQLPERTIRHFYVEMAPEQQKRHDEYLELIGRLVMISRRRPLTQEEWKKLQKFLSCMRMMCDSPYILDPTCRICPKLDELKLLLDPILTGEKSKIIIFSEWERMLELVRKELNGKGIEYAWHTGSVPQKARREQINRFKNDPDCRIFLSTESGATGLNLQCASVVVNLDLPWNPARLEQRIARAWRKHQKNKVRVFNLVARKSIEEKMIEKLDLKRRLFDGAIDGVDGIDNVATGGAQRAMLERLSEMLGDREATTEHAKSDSQYTPIPTVDQIAEFSKDFVAQHKSKICQITRHAGPEIGNLPVVMAVVRDMDEEIRVVTPAAMARDVSSVEIIDEATYATIKRLVEAGVLKFTGAAPDVLYCEDNVADDYSKELAQRYATAKPFIKDAVRQLKMVQLLRDNDFAQEALTPLKAAADYALKGAMVMADGTCKGQIEDITNEQIVDSLFPYAYASASAFATLMNLRKISKIDVATMQSASDAVEQLIAGIENAANNEKTERCLTKADH